MQGGDTVVIAIRCAINPNRKKQIHTALENLNGFQNYFHFVLEECCESDICDNDVVNWEEFYRNHHNEDMHTIYVTEKPFTDNWFSHEGPSFSIITTHDWETYYAPPSLRAYIVYQIAQSALSFEADLTEEMLLNMVHYHAKGCIFDLCQQKNDIKLGMIAGSMCPECRAILNTYGVSEVALQAVERILACARAEAIGKPILLNSNRAFVVMRFTQNNENNNAYLYGIRPALTDIGIESYRADNEILPGQLLDQIRSEISRSRYVIAKVDEQNLNVYYELGLAMGLGKDVLLISCDDLIINLPTDLKNWKCLTYPRGNYETLKDNVKKFFKDNYYY